MLYKELSLDGSVSQNPVTQERIRFIFLGEPGLIKDLKSLNPRRPDTTYDRFFEALSCIVDDVTAANDRRHGMAHMSEFISLEEMIEKAAAKCPEGTPIPSKSLVRLQFTPRNPFSKLALTFTSRIDVQYKIQRRQLRVSHPDDHYCNAQFKYLKERALELKDKCSLFFCDDKSKVHIGEPGSLVSTGVRGKQTIVPTTSTLSALDHDMTKASLTSSVFLDCDILDKIDSSFVRGQVTNIINDSVFEQSSPFRHAAAIVQLQKSTEKIPPVFLKFTDGGTDQRNTLEAMKCASVCIFRELNLDMLILGRCAPGRSYINPAERVMSILNLGLQNVALERGTSDEDIEKTLKQCNCMSAIRSKAIGNEVLKTGWLDSVEPVKAVLRERFSRLKLKETSFQSINPISEEEIDVLKRHLRELFSDLDLSKSQAYTTWMAKHARCRQYTFQLRKFDDPNCCLPATLSSECLPDPILDDTGEHYKPYAAMKGTNTTDEMRPSAIIKPPKKAKAAQIVPENEDPEAVPLVEEAKSSDASLFSTQNARALVTCTECSKPRVIYIQSPN